MNYKGRFNGDNLPKVKDGAWVINLDDKQSKGTHWIALFIDRSMALYSDYFEIDYIP